jgi:hypothetical protein
MQQRANSSAKAGAGKEETMKAVRLQHPSTNITVVPVGFSCCDVGFHT